MSPSFLETAFIYLDDIEVSVEIGIHDFERGTKQSFALGIEIEVESRYINTTEDITQVFDYDPIRDYVLLLAKQEAFKLQESYCRTVGNYIMSLPGVIGVSVRTSKPDVFPDTKGVGVHLKLRR